MSPSNRSLRGPWTVRWLCMLCALLGACASAPPQRYYTLAAVAPPAASGEAAPGYGVVIAPVTLPGSLDRPQLVSRVGTNRVQLLEQERWAEPLKDQIARVMADNLARQLPGARVQTSRDSAGRADAGPQWRLMMDVRQFELIAGEAVILEANWSLRPAGVGTSSSAPSQAPAAARSGHVLHREPVQGPGLEMAVAAHDRALAHMAGEIAAAVQGAPATR